MHDIAEFLRAHAPFDSLDEETLASVAESAEIEFFAARTTIVDSTDEVVQHAYVVRRGSVELVIDGRLLDLMRGTPSLPRRCSSPWQLTSRAAAVGQFAR